jgi:tetratricopeptide (TPR) repeat protein
VITPTVRSKRRRLALMGICTLLACLHALGAVAAPLSTSEAIGEENKKYREVEDAAAKFNAGDVEQALDLLEVAAIKHPELPPARVMLARLYFAKNQLARGRNELERAITETPDDPEAYDVLGSLAIGEGRFTEGEMLFQKVLQLLEKMPDSSVRKKNLAIHAHAGLATVGESRANWEYARQQLQDWIKLSEQAPQPRLRLGQVLFKLNKPEEAFAEFQTAARLSDQAPSPEVLMGRLYQIAGDDKKAEEWMTLAISRDPENPSAQLGVAQWYLELNKLDDAKKHADEALRLKPDLIDAKLLRGVIARYQGDLSEAEKQFEAVHLVAPANFAASNQLALVLAEQNDGSKLRRGMELAELNARQFGTNPEVLATLGAIYLRAGRIDEAEQALGRVLNAGQPISGDIAYYVAQLMVKRNKAADAIRWLKMALDAKGPFANRAAAQSLYEQLEKKS